MGTPFHSMVWEDSLSMGKIHDSRVTHLNVSRKKIRSVISMQDFAQNKSVMVFLMG